LAAHNFVSPHGTSIAHALAGGQIAMGMPTDISRPTRGISGSDVMFLLSVAFIFFAMVVSVAISRP